MKAKELAEILLQNPDNEVYAAEPGWNCHPIKEVKVEEAMVTDPSEEELDAIIEDETFSFEEAIQKVNPKSTVTMLY